MLKLPKGLKKKKKKSKKDQELFTEEELEQYKRGLKAKQEATVLNSGESDAASDVDCVASVSGFANASLVIKNNHTNSEETKISTQEGETVKQIEKDEEWEKFKKITSGIDSVLHKTQDELDRIKKESFYQRLPSAAEKKRLEENEAAKRVHEEQQKAAEVESSRDKLAEAVIELSESSEDELDLTDDIFATDYIEALTSGEIKLAVLPESPIDNLEEGPDPFDTAYAEKIIVGADKAKNNKKLVSLGAAVEVLSGRVDREHALALVNPKKKTRKGIKNLLLSESVDLEELESEVGTLEPQKNLFDELVTDVPAPDQPIDLSVSLHLQHLQSVQAESHEIKDEIEVKSPEPDFNLSEFDTLQREESDDEFAELAAESLTKKDEIQVITDISFSKEQVDTNWAEFEGASGSLTDLTSGSFIPGTVDVFEDDNVNADDDIFNTAYAERIIKTTTVLEEDDDFDPRAIEKGDISAVDKHHSLERKNTTESICSATSAQEISECARRKSSLNLNIHSKTVGFLIPDQDLLNTGIENIGNKKPLTPYYAPEIASNTLIESEDPFDTSFVPANKPSEIELKHLEQHLLNKPELKQSLSDPDFDPRASETSVLAEEIFTVTENISAKVLTPSLEQNVTTQKVETESDPFDTTIATDLKPGRVELKLLESELLPPKRADFYTGVIDIQSDAQELGLGDKVLTPSKPNNSTISHEEADPFDTSIAENLALGKIEIKLLESELIEG